MYLHIYLSLYNIYLHVDPKRKILITGSVPTENLPTKSHEVPKAERRILVRPDIQPSTSQEQPTSFEHTSAAGVSSIEELMADLNNMPMWKVEEMQDKEVSIKLFEEPYSIPKYTVLVDSGLEFSVFAYQWPIPDDHEIYKGTNRSVRNCSVKELLKELESSSMCVGLPDTDEVKDVVVDPTTQEYMPGAIVRHSVPKDSTAEEPNFEVFVSCRSVDCRVIKEKTYGQKDSCQPCATAFNAVNRAARRKSKALAEPAKSKASLAACGPEKLRATVQATRLECKQLQDRLKHLQTKIEKDGVGISASLETDLLKIMGGQNLESTPHMKFFWEQQMALLQSNKMGRRYHPQIIRFALSIHSKSASAYRELRDSGALILPSERVLRDYKNYFKPKAGINQENIECIREKTKHFTDLQRYIVLVMDEMKIQSNLVFDKVSGDLVGFVDLGDPMTNEAYVEEESVATHALAFLVRGLCTDMKHIVSYYFTRDVTSFQILPIFWKAVAVLELSLNLWVVATVNDGASPNRKFFHLHSQLAKDLKCDVVYKTPNVFATSRFIYFFPDSPHLLKTARNCLYNSGYGSRSRYMWNNDQYLIFRHIADLFYSDQEYALHTLPKLTMDHIVLTSYSKMKVIFHIWKFL